MKFAYLVLICLARPCTLNQGLNNAGTEFVLCYMDNDILMNSNDIELYITTPSQNQVIVTITTPLYDPAFHESVAVSKNLVSEVKIPVGIRGSGVAIENKGVRILASEDITVYSVNKETYSTDAFVAFPVETLGTDYVVVTWSTGGTFMLVSTEDETNIQIYFSQSYTENDVSFNGLTYRAGDKMDITLHKWETFHVYTRGDLTGTRVTSSHVIAVMSGSTKTSVLDKSVADQTSYADHLVEQLLPVQSWGREFVTISTPGRTIGDFLKVVAVEDSVNVTLGTSQSAILNAGDFQVFNLDSGRYVKVSADKAIMPVLFSKSSRFSLKTGDPSMSLLVPIQLYQSMYTFSTVDSDNGAFTNYLVIAIKDVYKEGLMLDQQSIDRTTDWAVVEGASDYVVTMLHISPGVHSVNNTVREATFLGMTFGNGRANSYAYASGLRLEKINSPTSTSVFTSTATATDAATCGTTTDKRATTTAAITRAANTDATATTTAATTGAATTTATTTATITSTTTTVAATATSVAYIGKTTSGTPTTRSTTTSEQICGIEKELLVSKAIDNFCLLLKMSDYMTQMTLDQRVEALQSNSRIDKKKTSKTRRRHTSAADDRHSAKIIRYVSSCVLLTVAVALMILIDVVPSKRELLEKAARNADRTTRARRLNHIYENEVGRNKTPADGNDSVRTRFTSEC